MHEVLVNHLGGLSLPRKSVVRLTDRPDMTLDVYSGRKTTTQQQQQITYFKLAKQSWQCSAKNARLSIQGHRYNHPLHQSFRRDFKSRSPSVYDLCVSEKVNQSLLT